MARTCVLAAGLPESVPATTIDRQCGSSQQAVHFAAQAVMSGTMDVVIAGGVQLMSKIPIGSAALVGPSLGFPDPYSTSTGWQARYAGEEISQFRGAQLIADRFGFKRVDLEAFALASNNPAAARSRSSLRAANTNRCVRPTASGFAASGASSTMR